MMEGDTLHAIKIISKIQQNILHNSYIKRFWVEGVLLTTISSIGVLGNIIS